MKVKINTHGNALPEVHGEWIDLCTAEDVTLDFLEYKIISLGVSIEIPAGYYAHIVPRSSTFGKWGILLANSMGVIENDYCGDGDVWGYYATEIDKYAIQTTQHNFPETVQLGDAFQVRDEEWRPRRAAEVE